MFVSCGLQSGWTDFDKIFRQSSQRDIPSSLVVIASLFPRNRRIKFSSTRTMSRENASNVYNLEAFLAQSSILQINSTSHSTSLLLR